MIRDIAQTLEKAMIMEDRIDYADYILKEDETMKLHADLKLLLDSEATTINIAELKNFIRLKEGVIHLFDCAAMGGVREPEDIPEEELIDE